MKRLNFIPTPKKPLRHGNLTNVHEEDIDMTFFNHISKIDLMGATNTKIDVRSYGEFAGKALYLDDCYDYVMGRDMNGLTILIPLKKKLS